LPTRGKQKFEIRRRKRRKIGGVIPQGSLIREGKGHSLHTPELERRGNAEKQTDAALERKGEFKNRR